MVYDVLTQAWIPLVTPSGDTVYAGIAEALAKAHEYAAIRGDNPLVTYGIHRLLLAFLQDALQPEDSFDIAELVSRGHFDADRLADYCDACREGGECFDLFDEQRPFLQHAFQPEDPAKPSPVSALFLQNSSGNNHIHFNHLLEQHSAATPEECLRALCTYAPFQLSHSRSMHPSINGKPPRYFLFAGENLFETLVCSMVSKAQMGNITYDEPAVAWRDKTPVPGKADIAAVSLLHGLTARPLRIQLLPQEDGSVSQVIMAYGYRYKDLRNWTDPHTAYSLNYRQERVPLRVVEGRAVWRDIGTILKAENRPMFLKHAELLLDSLPGERTSADCQVFGLLSEQKTALLMPVAWEEELLPLHRSLLHSEEQAALLDLCLTCLQDVGYALTRLMGRTIRQLEEPGGRSRLKGPYQKLGPQTEAAFLELAHQYLLNEFIPFVDERSGTSDDWDIDCMLEWGRKMRAFAVSAFQSVLSQMGQSAALLKWRSLAEYRLNGSISGILRKGGFIRDD
ncbi:MAG: type I-E CRISPR-associated protein Cse1/CasA [Eubacteriales bacterium]|nr:type I-E CRISPR-associated protein Cse1/CasA [Eubacteriales bacterium]